MDNYSGNQQGHGNAGAEHAQNCSPAPKWAALIDDRLFPMPRRKLAARDILDQAGIGRDYVLVRDHETQDPADILRERLRYAMNQASIRIRRDAEARPEEMVRRSVT